MKLEEFESPQKIIISIEHIQNNIMIYSWRVKRQRNGTTLRNFFIFSKNKLSSANFRK